MLANLSIVNTYFHKYMIDVKKPRKQLVEDVFDGVKNHGNFFMLQSIETLMVVS